jgi:hypothetical protein
VVKFKCNAANLKTSISINLKQSLLVSILFIFMQKQIISPGDTTKGSKWQGLQNKVKQIYKEDLPA